MLELIRSLCDKQIYHNVGSIPVTAFEKEPKKIIETLIEAHARYDTDISPVELRYIFDAKHPGLTKSQRDVYDVLFAKLRDVAPVQPCMVTDLVREMWRTEIGRQVSEAGFSLMEGHTNDLASVERLIDRHRDNIVMGTSPMEPVDLTPDVLMSQQETEERWAFNLGSLAKRVPGVSPGHFIVIGSRPETGKTSSHASFAVGPGGWVEQGARVHTLCNEEAATRVAWRYYCSALGVSKNDLTLDMVKQSSFQPFDASSGLYIARIPDDAGVDGIDTHLKEHMPDILVVDMLDKVSVDGMQYATSQHEKLRELYRRTRDLATKHNCVIFGYSQLSADAEGRVNLNNAMMENSRTGKAAEADLMILIGKYANIEGSQEDDPRRVLNVTKNKVTGWHGQIHVMLDGRRARYDD